jgi:hypothetical protein
MVNFAGQNPLDYLASNIDPVDMIRRMAMGPGSGPLGAMANGAIAGGNALQQLMASGGGMPASANMGGAPGMPPPSMTPPPSLPGMGQQPLLGGPPQMMGDGGSPVQTALAAAQGGGVPGAGGAAVPPSNLGGVEEYLGSPRTAIHRELLKMGINPGSNYHPYVRAAMKRADELIANVIGRGLLGDPSGAAFGSQEGIQGAVGGLLREAMSGKKVFGGFGQGDLGRIAGILGGTDQNQTPGLLNIVNLLSNENNAAGFISSLLHGGQSDRMKDIMTAPLLDAAQRYAMGLEQEIEGVDPTQGHYGSSLNLLTALLGSGNTELTRRTRCNQFPGLFNTPASSGTAGSYLNMMQR